MVVLRGAGPSRRPNKPCDMALPQTVININARALCLFVRSAGLHVPVRATPIALAGAAKQWRSRTRATDIVINYHEDRMQFPRFALYAFPQLQN